MSATHVDWETILSFVQWEDMLRLMCVNHDMLHGFRGSCISRKHTVVPSQAIAHAWKEKWWFLVQSPMSSIKRLVIETVVERVLNRPEVVAAVPSKVMTELRKRFQSLTPNTTWWSIANHDTNSIRACMEACFAMVATYASISISFYELVLFVIREYTQLKTVSRNAPFPVYTVQSRLLYLDYVSAPSFVCLPIEFHERKIHHQHNSTYEFHVELQKPMYRAESCAATIQQMYAYCAQRPRQCCFFALRLPYSESIHRPTSTSLTLLIWAPDEAPVKQKMVFTSYSNGTYFLMGIVNKAQANDLERCRDILHDLLE